MAWPCLVCACSTSWYVDDADAEVHALLDAHTEAVLGDRQSWVIPVSPAAVEPEAKPPEGGGAKPGQQGAPEPNAPAQQTPEATVFDLGSALRTAVSHNREYKSREEGLYLQGLGATLVHFNFGPLLNASVSGAWRQVEGQSETADVLGDLNASQILPTGGNLSLRGGLTTTRDLGKAFSASIDQPLLRGLGYEVSHDALIQSERSVVYAIRDFELFRQDFSIRIAQAFFDLVSQKKTLDNEDQNYQQAVFDRQKSETMFAMQRAKEQDVFRTRRREIEAEDLLIDARANYRAVLDDFKILLGLPTETVIDIADEEPTYEPVDIGLQSAVRAALHNRLDILTEKQRVEDAERSLRIARNGLLPDLDFDATANFDDGSGTLGSGIGSASAGLRLEIPLQRTPERNQYRSARIGLEQAQRNYSLLLDQLEIAVRDELRQLRSTELRIALQREQIEQQERTVVITEIRFEQGVIENRDLLEARQSLIDAENSLIRLLAEHFIRRLRLLRNLGLLFVGDDGMWR